MESVAGIVEKHASPTPRNAPVMTVAQTKQAVRLEP
jgi:hypothetical protein